jgi:hypothetical protein
MKAGVGEGVEKLEHLCVAGGNEPPAMVQPLWKLGWHLGSK